MAVAGYGNALLRALLKLVNARLGPQVRALSEPVLRGESRDKRYRKGGKPPSGGESAM
jgi:hypothetical protein